MIRVMDHMPIGAIGFEAKGKVTKEDYEDVLVPAVMAALEGGDVRLLYVLGDDFDSYSPGAMWSDTRLWAGHRDAWERVAVVTDVDWVENAIKAFGWLMPGKIRVFDDDDVDKAKLWLVTPDAD
jgi:SpoIIAA-like